LGDIHGFAEGTTIYIGVTPRANLRTSRRVLWDDTLRLQFGGRQGTAEFGMLAGRAHCISGDGGYMKRRLVPALLGACVAVALTGTPLAFAEQGQRPTVALLDFDFGTVQRWWSSNEDIGKGIADLIVDELVNDGSFRVIERKRLDAILAEQNFSNSDRADPSAKTVAAIGKVLGVKYLIVGSITKFGTEESNKSVGGGGFGVGGFGLGRVGTSKGKANVSITARIIDISTGEIMASARGEGTSKRSGLLLGGGGGGGGGAGIGEINMGSSNFHDTILGEATETAVKSTVTKLVAAKTRLQ
jgi:curli biogenesis system outer membrane secretion channel CsgG